MHVVEQVIIAILVIILEIVLTDMSQFLPLLREEWKRLDNDSEEGTKLS